MANKKPVSTWEELEHQLAVSTRTMLSNLDYSPIPGMVMTLVGGKKAELRHANHYLRWEEKVPALIGDFLANNPPKNEVLLFHNTMGAKAPYQDYLNRRIELEIKGRRDGGFPSVGIETKLERAQNQVAGLRNESREQAAAVIQAALTGSKQGKFR